jgi:glycerol uptake facilitator-like aquaporin
MVIESPLGARVASEFVGSAMLVAVGVGTALAGAGFGTVAIAHGLVVAAIVTATGHVSGAHINPVITLAMVLMRLKRPVEGCWYVIAQLAGAWAGMAAVAHGTGSSPGALATSVPTLGAGQSSMQAFMLVALGSFLLLWTVWAVGFDRDGAWFRVAGLPIGAAVAAGVLLLGPSNGAALATTRWFGPALYTGDWSRTPVWLLAPLVGGMLAVVVYTYVVRPRISVVAPSSMG